MNCYTTKKVFGDGAEVCIQKLTNNHTKLHIHEFIELVYTQSGEGWHEINGERFEVSKGDIIFINYGNDHVIHSDTGMVYYNILFTPGFLSTELTSSRNAFDLLMLSSFKCFSQTDVHPKFTYTGDELLLTETVISQMHNEYINKKTGYDEVLKSYMTILMTSIFRKMETLSPLPEKSKIPAEMLEFIENHYREKITINTLANRCFYNPSYFSRIFKETYGMTLTQYISEKRFDKARELLKTTKMTVEQIAIMSGYKNTAAIYKQFKTKLGITPHEFRTKQ